MALNLRTIMIQLFDEALASQGWPEPKDKGKMTKGRIVT